MSKKIFFLYDYFLPAFKAGGPIQSLNNLSSYLKDELKIKIICRNIDHDGTLLDVENDRWVKKNGIEVFYNSLGFQNIQKQIGPNDVIYINGIYSINYNFLPALKFKGRKIIATRGMLHPGALSQKSIKKRIYLEFWKLLGLHRKCEYHATTEDEKRYIQEAFGKKAKVWVVPNLPHILEKQPLPIKERGVLFLCSIGLVSPMKNHYLILKALSNCKYSVRYDIYGPIKDSNYWAKCEAIIKALPANIQVNFHGEVKPQNIGEALRRTHIFVLPSKSENFGHALFESLTAGRAVITSKHTPWNYLQYVKAGENVDVETEEDILKSINMFAQMPEDELREWSDGARTYALKIVDINSIKTKYLELFS